MLKIWELWVFSPSLVLLTFSAFLLQFMVQGACGVIGREAKGIEFMERNDQEVAEEMQRTV